jgi:hypothetical protein
MISSWSFFFSREVPVLLILLPFLVIAIKNAGQENVRGKIHRYARLDNKSFVNKRWQWHLLFSSNDG